MTTQRRSYERNDKVHTVSYLIRVETPFFIRTTTFLRQQPHITQKMHQTHKKKPKEIISSKHYKEGTSSCVCVVLATKEDVLNHNLMFLFALK